MSLTLNDLQDAAHGVAIDAQELADEIAGELLRPLIEMEQARAVEQVIVLWKQMPESMKARMRQSDPAQYAKLEQAISDMEKRGKNGTN